ncbi:hypothetical protein ACFL5V_01900 [Fibrobacterota bacterium]
MSKKKPESMISIKTGEECQIIREYWFYLENENGLAPELIEDLDGLYRKFSFGLSYVLTREKDGDAVTFEKELMALEKKYQLEKIDINDEITEEGRELRHYDIDPKEGDFLPFTFASDLSVLWKKSGFGVSFHIFREVDSLTGQMEDKLAWIREKFQVADEDFDIENYQAGDIEMVEKGADSQCYFLWPDESVSFSSQLTSDLQSLREKFSFDVSYTIARELDAETGSLEAELKRMMDDYNLFFLDEQEDIDESEEGDLVIRSYNLQRIEGDDLALDFVTELAETKNRFGMDVDYLLERQLDDRSPEFESHLKKLVKKYEMEEE